MQSDGEVMKNFVVIFAALCVLTACASSGNRVLKTETEQSLTEKVENGVTTKAQVRELFGSPFRTTFTDGGLEIWTYQFDDVSSDAVNFVPIVNLFTQSYSGTRKELVVLFDENDVVKKYSMSESEVKTKGGVTN